MPSTTVSECGNGTSDEGSDERLPSKTILIGIFAMLVSGCATAKTELMPSTQLELSDHARSSEFATIEIVRPPKILFGRVLGFIVVDSGSPLEPNATIVGKVGTDIDFLASLPAIPGAGYEEPAPIGLDGGPVILGGVEVSSDSHGIRIYFYDERGNSVPPEQFRPITVIGKLGPGGVLRWRRPAGLLHLTVIAAYIQPNLACRLVAPNPPFTSGTYCNIQASALQRTVEAGKVYRYISDIAELGKIQIYAVDE